MNIKTGWAVAAAAVFVVGFWAFIACAAVIGWGSAEEEKHFMAETGDTGAVVIVTGKKHNVTAHASKTSMRDAPAVSIDLEDAETGKSVIGITVNEEALKNGLDTSHPDWEYQEKHAVSVMILGDDLRMSTLQNPGASFHGRIQYDQESGVINLDAHGTAASVKREYGEVVGNTVDDFTVRLSVPFPLTAP